MSSTRRKTVCSISKEHKRLLHLGESDASSPDNDENGVAQVPLESFLPRSLSQIEAERTGLKLPSANVVSVNGKKQKLHVISVVTHPDGYFPALCLSAKLLDIDIKILGWGEKWGGFRWKLLKVLDYISTLPEDDVVLVIDGFDTLMVQPAHVILERFIATKQQFVCTGEKAPFFLWQIFHNTMFKDPEDPDWPTAPMQSSGPGVLNQMSDWWSRMSATPWMLNAGSWIAYAGAAKAVLKGCPPSEPNDQRYLTGLYLRDQMGVKVDTDCNLFHLYRGKKSYRMVRWDDVASPLSKLTGGRYKVVDWPEDRDPNVRVASPSTSTKASASSPSATSEKAGEEHDGRFVLSKTLLCGTLVDVDSGTAPCLLHVHCRRNIDSAVQELRLPPMMTRTLSASLWYLYYSIKGLAHVPRYMYLLIFAAILLLSIASSVIYGVYTVLPASLSAQRSICINKCPELTCPTTGSTSYPVLGSFNGLRPELAGQSLLGEPVELCVKSKSGQSTCWSMASGQNTKTAKKKANKK